MQNKTILRFHLTVVRKGITKKIRNAGENAEGYHWWEHTSEATMEISVRVQNKTKRTII